ncbi:hypothetical protein IQ266_24495 [filamentous cyanobacterium LEGE 11480]|uniref:Uncharacterized protein n=1 Tax=Romeriopsis navalis LEGE 11480 TaxID=2777977 RepID=A0A928Z762_9CYAN|nr:hypothetical protein [Romeriopsis navalis]MBE9032900.1 hypothetical protein [Romeriopsis navalis LEGE 11480]
MKALITTLVLLHFAGNLWHGNAHTTLEVPLSSFQTLFVVIVILISPLVGAILSWTRYFTIGNWTIGISMIGSVLFSVYYHYVLISIDNVEHLPPGTPAAQAHFANSAALIALLAFAAALLSFYAAGQFSNNRGCAKTSVDAALSKK